MNRIFYIIFSLFVIHSIAFASGGFSGGGVGQVTQAKDREKFHLGKAIYNLETELGQVDPNKVNAQTEKLEFLQGALPNSEKKRVNLLDLAGKLTDEQIQALEYFISVRFNVKLDK
ncbi:hypothetical protein LPTSP4_22080 [Leptospira ryugenii]|uniref:Lipoprotein n=1 Tax=Leptospira ryugenii TaxID=1917863 RepID=A0A2P2E1C3_9LEPT|nr:hypothetical protein [Leptospira ryugenii]GBF50681.1 hypothetical protein LPTSP4_22080 [Leptospira ryugenii]